MSQHLCITVRFLDPRFHGRRDGGEPEWPPSPLRLFQALVAANADHLGVEGGLDRALAWLETQDPPTVVAPRHKIGAPYRLSVPNNAMDLVGRAWSRGNYYGGGDANPATHRTMKLVRPVHMLDGEEVRYIWTMAQHDSFDSKAIESLRRASSRMIALGWGIDLVVGEAVIIDADERQKLTGDQWLPTDCTGTSPLRTPRRGTLNALQDRHADFLTRIGPDGFQPVPPLTVFNITGYHRATEPVGLPFAVFELRRPDGGFFTYSQRKLIHIAGMLRHVAIKAVTQAPPPDVADEASWVESFVVGHVQGDAQSHQQFSYVPLPSIRGRHEHVSPAIRRVMVIAPLGCKAWLQHLAQRVGGHVLEPTRETKIDAPPTLIRISGDSVTRQYSNPSNTWASVTPVILPGHDDQKAVKRDKLVRKALAQSGIDLPCEFETSAFSCFPKSLSAHKYDRNKRPTGYWRPDHLQSQTAVHVKLRFKNEVKVPGPLVLGAGRHCGFGLMAGID